MRKAFLFASFILQTTAHAYDPCGERPGDVVHRVAVIADMNSSYGSVTYLPSVGAGLKKILAMRPDLVVSAGDMVAGQQKNLGQPLLRRMWAAFNALVAEPLYAAKIPFAITPGNHDSAPGFPDDQKIFHEVWYNSKNLLVGSKVTAIDLKNYPDYYSFKLGDAFFVSLDSTSTGTFDGVQKAWVKAQLETNAASPVKIVYGHVPLYPVALSAPGKILDEARYDESFERMLKESGVTQTLWGHQHAYEPGVIRNSGLPMIALPALGAGPRALIGTKQISASSFVVMDIHDDHSLTIEACGAGSGFAKMIERKTLPAHIDTGYLMHSGRVIIDRDDVSSTSR